MTEELKNNELTEEELEDVSGGRGWSSYNSGVTSNFKVGECVYYTVGTTQWICVVREVTPKTMGLPCKEFTYTIELFYEGYSNHWTRVESQIVNNVLEDNLTHMEKPDMG